VEILLSERTKRNAMERIRKLTPRQWGGKLESCIAQLNAWLRGWHQFFGISSASEQSRLRALDAHIRRRLRAIVLRHWKADEQSHAGHTRSLTTPAAGGY
jgi:RNA-directed DNA polymerase